MVLVYISLGHIYRTTCVLYLWSRERVVLVYTSPGRGWSLFTPVQGEGGPCFHQSRERVVLVYVSPGGGARFVGTANC